MKTQIPLSKTDIDKVPGHWLFARLGKKVLRPGGKAFTKEILNNLLIDESKDVVEFAPAMGVSTALIKEKNPKSYFGIDLDPTVISNLTKRFPEYTFKNGSAAETGLDSESVDCVLSEAMLTMNSDKDAILKEASRILRKGGRFALHEVCYLDSVCDGTMEVGNKSLSHALKQNVAPLKKCEYVKLLTKNGFEVVCENEKKRDMLQFKQLVKDEGFFRTLNIKRKILFNKKLRSRLKTIKSSFDKQDAYLRAFYLVAQKK